MRVFRSVAEVPPGFGPSAVSIGKFDGVHAGHRAVIGELRSIAAARDLFSVVVTFDRHPLALLAPEKCPASLVSPRQKLDLLAGTGLSATLMVPFDRDFANQTPEEFVDRILVTALDARVVFVGADFRFGARGSGTIELLTQLGAQRGFEVRVIEDVRPRGGRRVSSTWIRELLDAGDVVAATRLLGHTPTVRGVVVHGAARGRELGFPTANLSPESEGLIPADGVYAGWLIDGGARHPAAISVGNNPTFEGVPQKQVEAYVLDRDIDLYDHIVDVEFGERIRGQIAFEGIDPLIAQMTSDVDRVRELLA
jgi:riboflavin kinase / FMN adenylyltransferase